MSWSIGVQILRLDPSCYILFLDLLGVNQNQTRKESAKGENQGQTQSKIRSNEGRCLRKRGRPFVFLGMSKLTPEEAIRKLEIAIKALQDLKLAWTPKKPVVKAGLSSELLSVKSKLRDHFRICPNTQSRAQLTKAIKTGEETPKELEDLKHHIGSICADEACNSNGFCRRFHTGLYVATRTLTPQVSTDLLHLARAARGKKSKTVHRGGPKPKAAPLFT